MKKKAPYNWVQGAFFYMTNLLRKTNLFLIFFAFLPVRPSKVELYVIYGTLYLFIDLYLLQAGILMGYITL